MTTSQTYAVLVTPTGRGAVSTILVHGQSGCPSVDVYFRSRTGKSLENLPTRKILFGHWAHDNSKAEELVVCRTDSKSVEIHCHGGDKAAEAILRALQTQGCRLLTWHDWLAKDPRPIQSEALRALALAQTRRTAEILLDQYYGALEASIHEILALLGHHRYGSAQEKLASLLARTDLGQHLISPWLVSLVGQPNVGKSSLINALVGYRRALVFNEPGTTRDVLRATTALDGWPIEFADTAGIRVTDENVEAQGVVLSQRTLAESQLILLVSDVSQPWTDDDQVVFDNNPAVLLVHNKADKLTTPSVPNDRPSGILTSALEEFGIEALSLQIPKCLISTPLERGVAVPFSDRQIRLLSQAFQRIQDGDAMNAQSQLASVIFRVDD